MKKQYANPKGLAASLCAAVLVAIALQLVRGGDAADFCLRLLFSGLAAMLLWRCRPLIVRYYFDGSNSAPRRFFAHLVFWVIVAIALFIGLKKFH